ncbi:MAG: hypothetical protein HYR90_01955 [Candidatus Andersenbacteria bacterium]|nr:hypothetical protein [Candidatus Andersenbacteria bacterium]MBI3250924.1 hypothetical protein [Candidatus Andersenbacteria bacterium]
MFQKLSDAIRKDKKRAYLLLGVGVLVLLLILIQATTPSRRMRQLRGAAENLAAAETMHTKAELELNLPVQLRTQERPIVGVTARVEGDVDNRGERPQLSGTVFTEARGRGMILFADGQIRILQDKVRFNLVNLPALLNPRGTLINKWTNVEVPLLETNNSDEVKNAIGAIVAGAKYVGEEDLPGVEGVSAKKFTRTFTAEEEEVLSEAFRQGHSGNRGLHILTRLLRAFDVRTFEIWVTGDEVRRVYTEFAKENDAEPRAKLTLEFSDFGKEVTIEEPEQEINVDGAVFGRIFGRGEISEIEN